MLREDYLTTVTRLYSDIQEVRKLEDKVSGFLSKDLQFEQHIKTASGLYIAENLDVPRQHLSDRLVSLPKR